MSNLGLILFRCDASHSIGTGHVMRCCTLARELQKRGGEILFLCRRQPGNLLSLLGSEFRVAALPEREFHGDFSSRGSPDDQFDCRSGLKSLDQEQDVVDCLDALNRLGLRQASWLVVDHYSLDIEWETRMIEGLKKNGPLANVPRVLVLDDLANKKHYCDILLNMCFGAQHSDYNLLLPSRALRLIGPAFALLREEFRLLRAVSLRRRNRANLASILISMGGMDTNQLTEPILDALCEMYAFRSFSVVIMLSSRAPHVERLKQKILKLPFKCDIITDSIQVAKIMCDSDIAITAGGLTSYELAAMGVPMLLIPASEIEQKSAEAIAQYASCKILALHRGFMRSEIQSHIANCVTALLEMQTQAVSHFAEIDGSGTLRVASEMENMIACSSHNL